MDPAELTEIQAPDDLQPPKRGRGRPPKNPTQPAAPKPKASSKTPASPASTSLGIADPLAEAERELAAAYRGFWATLSGVFGIDELKVSDSEVAEWSAPAARTVEQFGMTQQTKKLAPLSLAGVTAAQAAPRVAKIAAAGRKKQSPPRRPDAPSFVRPGATPPQPQPAPPATPGVTAFGSDNPLPVSALSDPAI